MNELNQGYLIVAASCRWCTPHRRSLLRRSPPTVLEDKRGHLSRDPSGAPAHRRARTWSSASCSDGHLKPTHPTYMQIEHGHLRHTAGEGDGWANWLNLATLLSHFPSSLAVSLHCRTLQLQCSRVTVSAEKLQRKLWWFGF